MAAISITKSALCVIMTDQPRIYMTIKRFFISLLLATLSLPAAVAQIGEPRHDLAIGLSAGMSINRVMFSPSIRQKGLSTPTFGLTLRYVSEKYLAAHCALQVELNYARLGWREDVRNVAGEPLTDTYERQVDYLQLPLLARMGWGREYRGLMFYFLAGPQLNYAFADREVYGSTWTLTAAGQPDRPNGVTQQYGLSIDHKLDYGITAGIGLELNTRHGHFMLEGRYYYGLGDIFKNSKKDPFERSANSTIVIKTTYLFPLTGGNAKVKE